MKLLITLTTLLAVGLFSTLSAHTTEDLKTPAPEMVSLLDDAPGIVLELTAPAANVHLVVDRIPVDRSMEVLTFSRSLESSPHAECRQCHDSHTSARNYNETHRHRLAYHDNSGQLNAQYSSPAVFTLSRFLAPYARDSA